MDHPFVNLSPRYRHIDFAPPDAMVAEAERGLAWWRAHDGRGGHEMALARAWRIRRRDPLSPDVVRRMAAHMAKLEQRKTVGGWNEWEREYPSASRITWALMGGDAGLAWARALVAQLDEADAGLIPNQRAGMLAGRTLTERQAGGRTHYVAPVVALVPGVVNGFLVTADALAASAAAWNGRPVTLRHPQANGSFLSADDPAAAHQRIGTLHNAAFTDGRLKGELWLDPELCAAAGPEGLAVLQVMQEGGTFEVSTGYFCQVVERAGEYEGAPYGGSRWTSHPTTWPCCPTRWARVRGLTAAVRRASMCVSRSRHLTRRVCLSKRTKLALRVCLSRLTQLTL